MSTSANPTPTSSHPPTANHTTTTTTPSSPSPPSPPSSPSTPILLALSGPTSSGKTTLATALHAILPPPLSLTVHADDFYKPDSQIPLRAGFQDWDCADSLDLGALERALRGLKAGGGGGGEGLSLLSLPRQGDFDGVHGVRGGVGLEGAVERMRGEVVDGNWWSKEQEQGKGRRRQLVIVDGFLLFGKSVPESLRGLFDIKILLRAGYEEAKRRREARNGYVTLEGFWRDPEGYFDMVVWPNYVREHGEMIGGGDGGGQRVWFSEPEWGLERCLEWVFGVVRREVEGFDSEGGDGDGDGLVSRSVPG